MISSYANVHHFIRSDVAVADEDTMWAGIIRLLLFFYYDRINYKLSLLTWKALHTAEPSDLSELISPYTPTCTLHSVNTGLLVLPTGVTSHFASRSLYVSSPSVWNSLPATSVLLIISLHLSAILNHTFPVSFRCLVTLRQHLRFVPYNIGAL